MRFRFAVGLFSIAVCLASSPVRAGVVILFEHQNFEGQRMTLRGDMPNLDRTDFNDRTESIRVREGTWEICTDSMFHGRCMRIFGPGEYPRLPGDIANRISSGRRIREQDLPMRPQGQR